VNPPNLLALSGLASTTVAASLVAALVLSKQNDNIPITTGAIGVPASSFVGRGVASTVRPGAASGVAAVFFSIGLSS
jgi:metal-dependent amidase/aminoacylase/carboxypeptidase family protein